MNIFGIRKLEYIEERYALAMGRIDEIRTEEVLEEPLRDYFQKAAGFVMKIHDLINKQEQGFFEKADLKALKQENHVLYEELLPEGYQTCYANPDYANERLGEELGSLLSMVYAELTGMIAYASDYRYDNVTIFAELLLALYHVAESSEQVPEQMKDTVYWFMSDYGDVLIPQRIQGLLDPKEEYMVRFLETADLSDIRYLYSMGEYIGEDEVRLAEYINGLDEKTIQRIAENFVEGYVRGYQVYGIDISRKKTVDVRFSVGMERIVKASLPMFRAKGLEPVIYRKAVCSLNKRQNIHVGFSSDGPNRQFEYDHRFDDALYLDKKYRERRLEILKAAYEENRGWCSVHGGPVLIEGFGAPNEEMVRKSGALYYSPQQQKLSTALRNEQAELVNRYISPEESSFCIVSYPVPSIGAQFEEIFTETIKVNTLDYEKYQKIQQCLIDALDGGYAVRVKGGNGNHTDITVALWDCNPQTETKFENCLADVNIPLGEVFTSPKLAGTNGVLHVTEVFLNGMRYENLELHFENGMVKDYHCTNFVKDADNQNYIRENVLFSHDTLPLGEFAIGTNTTAYAMAKRYQIFDRLDILIAEKTGPHFAVGDTCYSYCEDRAVYNPDGKEIIARENEVVMQRHEDPSKAYFSCHTDITIPYDELALIEVLCRDKEAVKILEKGRFVLPGTEGLNEALDALD